MFRSQTLTDGANGPFGIACADLNNDGRMDLIWTNDGNQFAIDNKLVFILNLATSPAGQITFSEPTILTIGFNPSDVSVADFNGDGFPDLVATLTDDKAIEVLFNRGNSSGAVTFSQVRIAVGASPYDVTIADFNQDGHADMAVTNNGDSTISVLINDNNAGLERTFTQSRWVGGIYPLSIWAADYSGDGRPDLVVSTANAVAFLTNTGAPGGAAGFSDSTVSIPIGDRPAEIVGGDFNKDGRQDIAVTSYFGDKVAVVLHSASGEGVSFDAPVYYTTGSRPWGIAAADFNNDALLDLIVCDVNSDTVSIFLGSSDVQPTAPPTAEQLSGGAIFGIIIGVTVAVMILMFVGMFIFRRYSPAAPPTPAAQQQAQEQPGWVEGEIRMQEYPAVVQDGTPSSPPPAETVTYPDAGPVSYASAPPTSASAPASVPAREASSAPPSPPAPNSNDFN